MDEAYAHARLTGINLIAVLEKALGDLSRVSRVVKLLGMVNATPDFTRHPQVIDGCSGDEVGTGDGYRCPPRDGIWGYGSDCRCRQIGEVVGRAR